MASKIQFMIYPAVGIARLGSSPKEYFLGPDVPILEHRPPFEPRIFTLPSKVVAPAKPADSKPFDKKWRDPAGSIRRQAARFRVYKVTLKKFGKSAWVPAKAEEVTKATGAKLAWSVDVANCKSFKDKVPHPTEPSRKIVPPFGDPLRVARRASASAESDSPFIEKLLAPSDATPILGIVFTDEAGRLRFLAAGGGASKFLTDAPNSFDKTSLFVKGWRDDVCDGVVRCKVTIQGKTEDAVAARVVTGVPNFARPVGQMVSLYDVAERIAINQKMWPAGDAFSFSKDIFPSLLAVQRTSVVSTQARAEHAGVIVDQTIKQGSLQADPDGKEFRRQIRKNLSMRDANKPGARELLFPPHAYPVNKSTGQIINDYSKCLEVSKKTVADLADRKIFKMPKQFYCVLLEPTLTRFMAWINEEKSFKWGDAGVAAPPKALESRTGVEQLDALNRANLGSMCGAATIPGIEVGFESSTPANFESAFRYRENLEPGRLTWTLSVPWPVDYYYCFEQDVPTKPKKKDFEWWPASRPLTIEINDVNRQWDRHWKMSTAEKWVTTWIKNGFIVHEGGQLVEREFEIVNP